MAYVSEGRVTIDLQGTGNSVIIAGVIGSRIEILHLVLYNNAVTVNDVILRDGDTEINGVGFGLLGGSGMETGFPIDEPLKITQGNSFVISNSVANVTGWCTYRQI